MKWLQNNVMGVILAAACGLLLLVAVSLAWVGSWPASSGEVDAAELDLAMEQRAEPDELEPLRSYRVVTDRPLFNQSRRPVIEIEESVQPEQEAAQATVAEAPQVSLTGVVITPEVKLVSLTPADGGEAVVFGEGKPMRGEYNGWVVSEVMPRAAVLESSSGQKVELSLVVHDQKIKEPPKPVRPEPEAPDEDQMGEDGEEPLSRAEEIRQRIAERREQLRREAAENQEGGDDAAAGEGPSPYAQAIRNMMGQGKKDQDDDDDEE